jgi:hypothetical protein
MIKPPKGDNEMEINPKEIVLWFRSHAARFNEIADFIEQTFGSPEIAAIPRRTQFPSSSANNPNGDVNAQQIRTALKHRNMRANKLAAKLGVSEGKILALVKKENGIEMAERGWIKLIPNWQPASSEEVKK